MSGVQEYALIFAVFMGVTLSCQLFKLREEVKTLERKVVILARSDLTTKDCVRRLTNVVRDINNVVTEITK